MIPIASVKMQNDSDGNRTRVTAVKGRCLNRLTTEPHRTSISSAKYLVVKNGEGGIWTLAPVTRPIPLAGAPLRPLEYFCFSFMCHIRDAKVILYDSPLFVNTFLSFFLFFYNSSIFLPRPLSFPLITTSHQYIKLVLFQVINQLNSIKDHPITMLLLVASISSISS